MLLGKYHDKHEICIDEAGRGCLAGPVFAAAVIWPRDSSIDSSMIKDSKKLSHKKRELVAPYIEKHAIAYGIGSASAEEIDKINILQGTYLAMHRAIREVEKKISIQENHILLVDGKYFKPYWLESNDFIEHECITKGDSTYIGIAAASILAKVYHDRFIRKLCSENPQYQFLYRWENNMCYGTKTHIDAIRENGICSLHRKTFGICKSSKLVER